MSDSEISYTPPGEIAPAPGPQGLSDEQLLAELSRRGIRVGAPVPGGVEQSREDAAERLAGLSNEQLSEEAARAWANTASQEDGMSQPAHELAERPLFKELLARYADGRIRPGMPELTPGNTDAENMEHHRNKNFADLFVEDMAKFKLDTALEKGPEAIHALADDEIVSWINMDEVASGKYDNGSWDLLYNELASRHGVVEFDSGYNGDGEKTVWSAVPLADGRCVIKRSTHSSDGNEPASPTTRNDLRVQDRADVLEHAQIQAEEAERRRNELQEELDELNRVAETARNAAEKLSGK